MSRKRESSKVMIAPDVLLKLTGRTMMSPAPWELWVVAPDATYFQFTNQGREADILPESREVGLKLRELLLRLLANEKPVRWMISMGTEDELVASETRREPWKPYTTKRKSNG